MENDFPAAHSMDTDWFAVDKEGHVGLFSTGEDGHVPEGAEEGYELLEALVRVRPGPFRGQDALYDMDTGELVASLGVFHYGYGGSYFGAVSPYTLTAPPQTPLHVDELPPDLRQRCKQIRFEKVDFARDKMFQPLESFPCVFWGERVAYLCADGKTVRPIPGQEETFAEFCREFRQAHPDQARAFRFEGAEDEPPPRPRRRRKKG